VGPLIALAACSAPPVRLWIAGDVHLAVPRPLLAPALRDELDGVGFVNLEGPVGAARTDIDPDGTVHLVHDGAVLGALRDAGVGVVGVANNHAGDAGPDGIEVTRRAVEAAGLVATPGRLAGVDVVQVDLEDALPADLPDRLAGAEVVAFHVTGPPDPRPSELLRAAVDLAVEAGAKVVVAHGTHAFGPVERRGEAVIAWGLGNLDFDCPCTRSRDGLVLEVTLGDPVTARIVPIAAGLDREPATLAADPAAILDVVSALSPTSLEGSRF
jgi:poly-gamma-glutamate capsule biosynthesis protein CapA/YwtB (metallophosphatase superfamily)